MKKHHGFALFISIMTIFAIIGLALIITGALTEQSPFYPLLPPRPFII